MLTRMARNGRIAACGAISNYNSSGDAITGLKNWFEVVTMRIEIKVRLSMSNIRANFHTKPSP